MMVKVVRNNFTYSYDGIKTINYAKDDSVDVRQEHVAGLVAEGWVTADASAKASVKPAEPVIAKIEETDPVKQATVDYDDDIGTVVIPDDWETLKWFSLKSLASKLSSADVKDSADARSIIEAELARRKGSPAE